MLYFTLVFFFGSKEVPCQFNDQNADRLFGSPSFLHLVLVIKRWDKGAKIEMQQMEKLHFSRLSK